MDTGLFPKQAEFYKAFQSKEFLYLLYGGAAGGGKSILQIGILHRLCIDYPGTRFAVVRKNLSTLKKTSIPSYEKVLEFNGGGEMVKMNRTDFVAHYTNGSQLLFLEADISKDPRLLKLAGVEVTGALIEEANELVEMVFTILKIRVGRWKNKEYDIPNFILLNCNPDKNWVKDLFYDPYSEGIIKPPYYYLPALPTDNPHNTESYIDALHSLPEAEKQKFALGNWEYSDDPDQLIRYIWIKAQLIAESVTFESLVEKREGKFDVALGIDAARGGGNLTVFAYFVGNKMCRLERFDIEDSIEIAEIAVMRMTEYNIPHKKVGIDTVGGYGSGIYDNIKRLTGKRVTAFNSGETPTRKPNDIHNYKNLRAQAHWEIREDLRMGKIEVLNDKALIKQATSVHYFVKEKNIQMESKESLVTRIGSSPDEFDATVIANYVRKKIPGDFKDIRLGKRLAFATKR